MDQPSARLYGQRTLMHLILCSTCRTLALGLRDKLHPWGPPFVSSCHPAIQVLVQGALKYEDNSVSYSERWPRSKSLPNILKSRISGTCT
ncbi:hypothetical protein B0H14DRAFT_3011575 [Mycena olivaceomarginata]|nr:hypothetical protein B0H14DRAFT_3011575 [Mycena olivaceomarginata]